MRIRPSFPWFLLAGLVAVLLVSVGSGGETARDASEGRVVRVVDGDTIRVVHEGREEPVRLIGVDTPESVKPGSPVECFGKAAAAFTRRELDGRRVRLVPDVEERDRYGRLLAYVFRVADGRFHNQALIAEGYAKPLTIRPNVRYEGRFRRLARGARREDRGLWRAC